MAASVAQSPAAPTPPLANGQKYVPALFSPSANAPASSPGPSLFSGAFRIPDPPQRLKARSQSSELHELSNHGTASPFISSPSLQQQQRPSSLPRPVRLVRSSFNLSSLSESMDTDLEPSDSPQPNITQRAFESPASLHQPDSSPFSLGGTPSAQPRTPAEHSFNATPFHHNHFSHGRTASIFSEPDILAADQIGSTFFTPQTKLVKPNPAAFHSTGLISKRNRPRPPETPKPMPETPLKKAHHFPTHPSGARRTDIFHEAMALPVGTPSHSTNFSSAFSRPYEAPTPTHLHPQTPTRFPVSSVKSKHLRSPLQESPIKNSKKLHRNGDSSSAAPVRGFRRVGDDSTSPIAIKHQQQQSQREIAGSPESPAHISSRNSGFQCIPQTSQSHAMDSPPPRLGIPSTRSFGEERRVSFPQFGRKPKNSENQPPSRASTTGPLLDSQFSPFAQSLPTSAGSQEASNNSLRPNDGLDMMDLDSDVHTPTTAAPPPRPMFNVRHNSSGYNHLVTPYPLFLNPQYFLQLQARNGRPPSPDPIRYSGSYPDYLDANFRVVERLGRGSFAEAYKVQEKTTGHFYAVKKTLHAFSGYKDGLNKLGEVEILWQVGVHPHCVCLVASWVQFGYLYLQMELCDCGSLYTYLEDHCRDSSLEEYRIWHILAEIASGVKHIHDLNLVHLDLKPGNIFITNNGSLKIGDFGLAAKAPVSRHDDREGDRTYIAPEILRDPSFGKAADIFSLGLIILEIAANVILPENGPYWHKLRQGDLTEINFGQELSPALLDLVRSMLDPDPVMRPTADALLMHPYVAQIVAKQAEAQAQAMTSGDEQVPGALLAT